MITKAFDGTWIVLPFHEIKPTAPLSLNILILNIRLAEVKNQDMWDLDFWKDLKDNPRLKLKGVQRTAECVRFVQHFKLYDLLTGVLGVDKVYIIFHINSTYFQGWSQ